MTGRKRVATAGLTAVLGRNLSGTNLQRAGDHNQRVTLHAIRVSGPVTRTDLVLMTGLTPAAIANITNRLLRQRLIVKSGTVRGGRGQPAVKLSIHPGSCYSLGLHIDRDHITLVLVDFAGKVRARSSREVAFALPETVQTSVRRMAGRLLERARIGVGRVAGLGVAFPDDIQRASLPQQPPQYAAWGAVSVERLLARVLPVPVFLENDAAAAAIGEMHFGLGQRYQSFFYILITAGLGGGLVVDGHYVRGATGRSGELGLLPTHAGNEAPRTLQSVVSISALAARLAAQGTHISSPRRLRRLAEQDLPTVERWIADSVDALEATLVTVDCLLNPEAILIGGRLPAPLIERLAARLNERLRAYAPVIPSVAPIERAALAEDAPAVGAAILPFTSRFLPTRLALMKNPDER